MVKWLKRLLGVRHKTAAEVIDNLRKKGARIGHDVRIYSPNNTIIDSTAAYLLSIGDHVCITDGAKILTHDFAWSVLKDFAPEGVEPGAILGCQAPVEIGSHVFIGMNAVITCGVKIGDHVIIGAGSVVTKDCEPNSVYAGNPARRICSLETFYDRRRARQFEEARLTEKHYRERFGTEPPMEIFKEHFMLFCTREEAEANPVFRSQMAQMGSYDLTAAYMDSHPPRFNGYAAFLKACREENET